MNKTNKEIRFDEHEVISVPHQMPIKCWSCKSFEEVAINDGEWDYEQFDTMEQAAEAFGGTDEIPEALKGELINGPAVWISDNNDQYAIPAAGFDPEQSAKDWLAHDEHTMIVMDSLADAKWELEHYRGHREIEVKCAIERIIEKYQQNEEE